MLSVADGVRVGAEVDGHIVGLTEGFEEKEMKLGSIHGLEDGL